MRANYPSDPTRCPNCRAEGTLYIDAGVYKCRLCGYAEKRPQLKADPPAAPKRKFQATYGITHRGPLDPWARAAYDTGLDCIRREDYDEAIKAFVRALDAQSDFIDAHLWIAQLVEDEAAKRDHLTTVLAHDPNHLEALRELMVLDGRLTQEEADRTHHYNEPEVRRVDVPVGMQTDVLRCPVCGGDLTVDETLGRVECKFCGYTEQRQPQRAGAAESLTMALLERKAQPVRWVIGERLLHCNNCGAERTIHGDKLSTRCPFCGSNHVIVQDALGSFQQPDALVRFGVSRQQAGVAIKEKLGSLGERIKGWFDNNKVKNASLQGFYLPFWVFDAVVEVTRTTVDSRTSERWGAPSQPYCRETIPELVNNLPVCAVESPSSTMTARLGTYDLDGMIAYQRELLAKYPAGLYTIDFDKASLEARSVISGMMRDKYDRSTGSDEIRVNIFSGVKQMSFQLVLLPVWVATLLEQDGDIRLALVNGQSGTVVLGQAQKRR